MENIWAVPKNLRPDPIRSRLRSLVLLLVLGTALVATTALVAFGRFLGPVGAVAVVVAALALNTGVLVVAFRVTTTRTLSVRDVLPGALAAAVVWQLLQWFGASYVQHVVASASVTNSVFAVVLGLIAFLYLISTVLLICAEVNVVRVDRLHPRALLTPFTDDVELTEADRKMYEGQAKAQQAKGFQRVEVTFEDHPAGRD
jgi:membrane protein